MDKSIILIGMPSAGKSTIGKLVAKRTGRGFIDTDLMIKEKEKRELREIVEIEGLQKFLEKQEAVITGAAFSGLVVATGGSVVYSRNSMEHLSSSGTIIYLKLSLSVIEQRVAPGRRFARNMDQSLSDLYNERTPLYEKYADITIDCSELDEESTANKVLEVLNLRMV